MTIYDKPSWCGAPDPTIKLFLLLLHNCNFSTFKHRDIHNWYAGYLICLHLLKNHPNRKGIEKHRFNMFCKQNMLYLFSSVVSSMPKILSSVSCLQLEMLASVVPLCLPITYISWILLVCIIFITSLSWTVLLFSFKHLFLLGCIKFFNWFVDLLWFFIINSWWGRTQFSLICGNSTVLQSLQTQEDQGRKDTFMDDWIT